MAINQHSLDRQLHMSAEARGVLPIYAVAVAGFLLYLCAIWLCSNLQYYPGLDTVIYVYRQDRWLLLVETGLLLLASIGLRDRFHKLELSRAALVFLAIAAIALCWLGHKWILCGYDASRDEQMAVFDTRIFASGRLAQPLPPAWQAHADALRTVFMLPVLHPVAWVSSYLPMNAMLRAAIGLAGDPTLTGPLMVALGMFALWKCARILWPDEREAAIVALLLYVGSGQVLFAGMTAYAMPAHLALDLVWLWLFLLDRRGADVAALLVGFVATGLHQPLFHPLFAVPILFTLLLPERNWPRIVLYAAGYAAICGFWLAWPAWMSALATGPDSSAVANGTSYFVRLVKALSKGDPMRWQGMGANLLRFFAWQHPLFLPLLASAGFVLRRNRYAIAFAASLILPVCVMAAILPWQGHGFGYRYLHGVIGVGILLAVYGWRFLAERCGWLRPLFLRMTVAGLVLLLPLQAWMAYSFYAPFAHIDQRITASGADYFITGTGDAPFSHDLVINRPDLSNRPLRLLGEKLDNQLIQEICHPGVRVLMPTSAAYRPIEEYFDLKPLAIADQRIASLSPRLIAAGCTVDRLDGP